MQAARGLVVLLVLGVLAFAVLGSCVDRVGPDVRIVTGTVTHASGAPAESAHVWVPGDTVLTDAQGRYRLALRADRFVTVFASDCCVPGYAYAQTCWGSAPAGPWAAKSDVDIVLDHCTTI